MARCPGLSISMSSLGTSSNHPGDQRAPKQDALAHLQRLIASDPQASKWHIVLDNLNIHQSESLVRWVAEREGIAPETLGIKGKSGILQSMESRAAFLHDPTHQVVFYYTRQPCLLDESGGNLAEHFGAQVAQAVNPNILRLMATSGAYCLFVWNNIGKQ